MQILKIFTRSLVVCGAALFLSGCGDESSSMGQGQRPPSVVGVIEVKYETVTLTSQLPGRTSAFMVAEVRPQVSGILKARLFDEGAEVQAGDVLYQIDPAPFEATYNSARAALARSEATLAAAKLRADRVNELVKRNAVSVQEAEDANAAYQQAQASVAADKAAVESARINLNYARVTAPISGKIGRSTVTQGALVTANQASPLATIQQIDRIYVDITQSSMDLLRLRRNLESGLLRRSEDGSTKVTLLLEDGTAYSEEGALQFSEVSVDPTTGSVTLRAEFPNPGKVLMPGMYVRTVLEEGVDDKAMLIPQEGLIRDAKGRAFLMIVTPENTLEQRLVTASRTIGDKWLVTEGIQPGEKVVVEGLLMVRPGMPVRPEPATNRDANGNSTVRPNGNGNGNGANAGQTQPTGDAAQAAQQ